MLATAASSLVGRPRSRNTSSTPTLHIWTTEDMSKALEPSTVQRGIIAAIRGCQARKL
ncbi:hypothetical protein BDV98DRAFT_557283 [Pterulicium gracile]|uniref:Uncharacterized protein n=1 Tax=Pterulicium gracile TaxID=1884261 RepID=A0A5C3QYM4_9AGAR|nr:hypothetical protein BDV98DRAFT_557283 [Pterula gracilis]